MTCQRLTYVIIDYVSGDLGAETTAIFEEHLRVCPDCVAFLNTYRGTIRATRSLAYDSIPEEMRDRVRQFLHKTIPGFLPSNS